MQNASAELNTALSFVTRRVEEEAERSGGPLQEELRVLLECLPTSSGIEDSDLSPRNIPYENLCTLARDAYERDLRTSPRNATHWELVAAVLNVYEHPMGWLLQRAGVKIPRPKWDRLLCLGAALLLIVFMGAVIMLAESYKLMWAPVQWITLMCAAVVVFLSWRYLRRFQNSQRKQLIESYRQKLNTE